MALDKDRFEREKKDGKKVIACCTIFDATGKIVVKGALTHEEVGEWVDKLLAKAPGLAVDVGAYKELTDLAKSVAAGKGLADAAKRLEKDERDEAKRLLAAIRRWMTDKEASAMAALAKDIAVAEMRFKEVGAKPEADAVKAARELERVREELLKTPCCKKCASLGARFVCTSCAACREDQKEPLAGLKARLEKLLAVEALAAEAKALLIGWNSK